MALALASRLPRRTVREYESPANIHNNNKKHKFAVLILKDRIS